MDKFFRVEKPVPQQQRAAKGQKPGAASAPRLHEWADVVSADARDVDVAGLSERDIEHVLRLFDLNPAFGPFVGIDREFRWVRAERCGLRPPLVVKRVIDSGRAAPQRDAGHLW